MDKYKVATAMSLEFDTDDIDLIINVIMMRHVPALHEGVDCPGEYSSARHCPPPHTNFKYSLWTVITHLNDDHTWSRWQIADWLETLDLDLTFRKVDNDQLT